MPPQSVINKIGQFGFFALMLLFTTLLTSSCTDTAPVDVPAVVYEDQPTQTRSAGCALDLTQICTNPQPVETELVAGLTHPDYPGCTFSVQVEHVECDGRIYVGGFQVVSHNCPAFETRMMNALQQGRSTFLDFINDFEEKMYDVMTPILALSSQAGIPDCDIGTTTTVEWIKANCYVTCINYPVMNDGPGSLGNAGSSQQYLTYTTAPCISSGCCTRESEICIDAQGQFDITSIWFLESVATDCANSVIDLSQFDSAATECIFETPCEDFDCD